MIGPRYLVFAIEVGINEVTAHGVWRDIGSQTCGLCCHGLPRISIGVLRNFAFRSINW